MKLKITIDGKTYEVRWRWPRKCRKLLATFVVQSGTAAFLPPLSELEQQEVDSGAVNDEARSAQPRFRHCMESNVRWARRSKPGDLLLVLEAMKMETEITAPVGGKVAASK